MSLLAVDIGNTGTTLGLLEDGEVRHHWRVTTEERRTADEWGVLLRGLLGDLRPSRGVAVCATVPAVLQQWRQVMTEQLPGLPQVVVGGPGVRTGVPVLTDNPREVGADRVVNALAAAHRFGGPAVVVDLGTATTYDVLSPHGEYVGGAIAPGIEISLDALGSRGAQLRRVELTRPRSVIGKNTVEALQSGALFGFAAQVDGMVARIIETLGVPPATVSVVATGALAPLVLEECRSVTAHEPWLTLLGLELVFSRNRPA